MPWEAEDLRTTMAATVASSRLPVLKAIAAFAIALLFLKVFLSILVEYRWYFPADFDNSAFLSGRRYTFVGIYRPAFYAHIISGPIAVVLGSFLMWSGAKNGRLKYFHRAAGKLQMLVVLAVVVPSGVVMARQAYAGPIAALGFTALSLATGGSALAALWFALARQFQSHQLWATRCYLLLVSPLLLRLIAGAVVVLQWESDLTYRLNAWLSWLIPLALYEAWHWNQANKRTKRTVQSVHHGLEEALR